MANTTISLIDIVDGQIIFAEHVQRIIYALDSTAANTIIIKGDVIQGNTSNITNDDNSFAQGDGTTASGNYSHAEGKGTSAQNDSSHAEGNTTIASGKYSHAEGEQTQASGESSHAEGYYTIASADYQTAAGRYNTAANSTDYFVIGNGSIGNRKDAFGVNANGTYISSSFYLPGLGTSPEANILVFSAATGQVFYTASSAFQAPDPPVYFTINGYSFNAAGDKLVFTGSNGLVATVTDIGVDLTASYGFPTNAQVILGGITSSLFGSASYATTASYALNGGGTGTPGGSNTQIQFNSASVFSGSAKFNFNYTINKVLLTGSMVISGSTQTSSLTLIGSGSLQPISTVIGSQGTLFSVYDSLSGSLFSVIDISSQPILEVFSDNTIVIGTNGTNNPPSLYVTKKLVTAASGQFALGLGLISTSSYDGAYFEYIVKSGSNARSGYITSTWSGSNVVSSSITSSNIGDTSGLTTFVAISSSYIVLSGSANAANWTIKSIIRTI